MRVDPTQKLDISLTEIVPEYYSSNPIVAWLFHKRLNLAVSLLRKTGARNIVDVGCGDGSLIALLQDENYQYDHLYGVDLNPGVLTLKEKFSNCHLEVQYIMNLTLPQKYFDTVLCLDTLEHIKNIDYAIEELKKIIVPEGHLITSEPVESILYKTLRFLLKGTYSQESGPGAGKHYYNAREIDAIIRSHGFQMSKMYRIPFIYPFDLFNITLYRLKS